MTVFVSTILAAMGNDIVGLAKETFRSYSRHDGRMLAAAVAFSSLLSVAPLLVIALHVAGIATSEDAARASVIDDLGRLIGADGARTIALLLDRAEQNQKAGWASALSGVVLVYASTRLFSQLKRALNHMWDVQVRSGHGIRGKAMKQIRKRALAFVMVVFVGIVIVALVAIKAVLVLAAGALGGALAGVAWRVGEIVLSLLTTTLLFAMVFKVMPDAELAWRDAWAGAFLTAVLFGIGAALIGLYLGHKALGAMYGAAGSIVMLLLFANYSAQVFFIGAAFTAVLAARGARAITPTPNARRIQVEGSEESPHD